MKIKPGKWGILMAFFGIAMANQMLWLNFSPLITYMMDLYQASEDLVTITMIMIFPIMYVLLSVHAGSLIDRVGYKKIVSIGSIIMLIGSIIRIYHSSFWVVFVGQMIIAISQPYIINGISKIVADWFPEDQGSTATGIASAGMFVGMAVGAALTPVFLEASGFTGMLIISAGITMVTVLIFLMVIRENNSIEKNVITTGSFRDFWGLLRNKNILLINLISFLALGFFNGFTGLIEPILAEQNISKNDAGMIAGLLIFGGIIGAAIIPAVSDKVGKRKPFIVLSALIASIFAYPLMAGSNLTLLMIYSGLIGVFFLPGYPLLIASSEEESGKDKAGSSTGLLMLSGNLGGIIVLFAMLGLKGNTTTWIHSIYFCVGIVVLALALSLFLKETFHKRT